MFGDMLGDHTLADGGAAELRLHATASASRTPRRRSRYMNQAHRWNWGLVGGQIPYLSGGFQSAVGVIGRTSRSRSIRRSSSGRRSRAPPAIVAYPFNRAQRIEFQGGVHARSRSIRSCETTAFSLNTGELLRRHDTTRQSLARAADARRHRRRRMCTTRRTSARPARCRDSGIASRRRRRSDRSTSRACSPTTDGTSCRCRSTRSPRA